MAKKEVWTPPPDPDFSVMARVGWEAWRRDRPDLIAFDTETTGVGWWDELFCTTMAWRNAEGNMEAHYFESKKWPGDKMVSEILTSTSILVGHNIKFDLHKVVNAGIFPQALIDSIEIHDTEALAHLDDEHRLKGLKPLAVSVLGYNDIIEVEVKSGPNKGRVRQVPREKYELDMVRRKLKLTKEDGFHLLPRAIIAPYAIKDAEFTLQLYEVLRPCIEKYDDLWELYLQEMELTKVFIDMERHGMGVDFPYVLDKITEYNNMILEKELAMEKIVGKEIGKTKSQFNPNSNQQVADFFLDAGFPSDSYDEEHLADIDHPLAQALGALRKDQKILNTYFRALKNGTRDGVFHPSIRQHGTVTGRTSSGGAKGDNG